MPYVKSKKKALLNLINIDAQKARKQMHPVILSKEITEWDQSTYQEITSIDLNQTQVDQIACPQEIYPQQDEVVALHWHPEFIPMNLIHDRIDRMFPNKKKALVIPTDHNVLKTYDGQYTGVEVDCFSPQFNRKVQLLLHFKNSRLEKADTLKSMLTHTLKYRSTQMFELIDSISDSRFEHRLHDAAKRTGADDGLIRFVQFHTKKLQTLFCENKETTPVTHIKNKLLTNYFDRLLEFYDEHVINQAQQLIREVKQIVKRNFANKHFFRTEEVIEEARAVKCGIVVPHPEQFWPILLAEYDVDGYEVWNPQSKNYTEFLIDVVMRQNKTQERASRPLLVFMGDDTHMGEKTKTLECQNNSKASRQIGLQIAWDNPAIQKNLSIANMSRAKLIDEYKARLN